MEVIKDSAPVDKTKLDPNKVWEDCKKQPSGSDSLCSTPKNMTWPPLSGLFKSFQCSQIFFVYGLTTIWLGLKETILKGRDHNRSYQLLKIICVPDTTLDPLRTSFHFILLKPFAISVVIPTLQMRKERVSNCPRSCKCQNQYSNSGSVILKPALFF